MAGSSTYPGSVDNKTALQNGVDIIDADDVNDCYVMADAIETFVGTIGTDKTQSWTTDIMEYLCNHKAPTVTKASGSTLTVSPGAVAIKNAGQSNRFLRRNVNPITVDSTFIDQGSMADATIYYVFAVADTAASTFTVKFSLSSTSPNGLTNFELIGWFYNQAAGSLSLTGGFVGNVKTNGRDVPNQVKVAASSAISAQTVDASYTVLTGFTAQFYSSGRPVLILFGGAFTLSGSDQQAVFEAHIDGAASGIKSSTYSYGSQNTYLSGVTTMAAGLHSIDIRHKDGSPGAGTIATDPSGASGSTPTLIIIEL